MKGHIDYIGLVKAHAIAKSKVAVWLSAGVKPKLRHVHLPEMSTTTRFALSVSHYNF